MTIKFKIYKSFKIILLSIFSGNSRSANVEEKKESSLLPMTSDNHFVYPYDVIDCSVSGSSFIEFKLNSEVGVEYLQIIESPGISFDKSIINGLNNYVS